MAIISTHLHFELWSNPALSTEPLCSTVCCVSARKYLFRLWQINSFFIGCLSNCICQPSPAPQCIPFTPCFVLSVLSLSPQKQKWFHGSFLQLLYCFLVRHHGTSKEQSSLKNCTKWEHGCVDRTHVSVQEQLHSVTLRAGCKGFLPLLFQACSHSHRFFCLLGCSSYVRAVSEHRNQNWDSMQGKAQ